LTYDENDGGRPAVAMTDEQFKDFVACMKATGADSGQTPDDLTSGQKRVALRYQLVRNGLLRHVNPAETVNQVLMTITQRIRKDYVEKDCQEKYYLELATTDPIPPAARSLLVTIGDTREPGKLSRAGRDGVFAELPVCESTVGASLVEFVDTLDARTGSTVAEGIPSPLKKQNRYRALDEYLGELINAKYPQLAGRTPPPAGGAASESAAASGEPSTAAAHQPLEKRDELSTGESSATPPTAPPTRRVRNPRRSNS
jgi:hypothetical protein